ncbi:hypothetical protein FQN51_006235, partial [Onygenales sp. PD_10]
MAGIFLDMVKLARAWDEVEASKKVEPVHVPNAQSCDIELDPYRKYMAPKNRCLTVNQRSTDSQLDQTVEHKLYANH